MTLFDDGGAEKRGPAPFSYMEDEMRLRGLPLPPRTPGLLSTRAKTLLLAGATAAGGVLPAAPVFADSPPGPDVVVEESPGPLVGGAADPEAQAQQPGSDDSADGPAGDQAGSDNTPDPESPPTADAGEGQDPSVGAPPQAAEPDVAADPAAPAPGPAAPQPAPAP